MKSNASFKLSKQSKIHIANISDPHQKGKILRSFIEAEIMQHIKPKIIKQRKENLKETE